MAKERIDKYDVEILQKTVHVDTSPAIAKKAKRGDVNTTAQRRTTVAPIRPFTEMVKAQRDEMKYNPVEVRRQVGHSPETEFMLKKRRGPDLNETDWLFIFKMYQWTNGQSEYTKISDPQFLCNEYTGERGAFVIGEIGKDGYPKIDWPKLAANFGGYKEPKTSREIEAVKNKTDVFRRMVNDLCSKKEKRFIGAYDEIQPDGKMTRIYKVITPLDFHVSERNGKKYVVLQLDEYFTNNGQSFVTWQTFGANFFDMFRKMTFQKQTLNLFFELLTMTAGNINSKGVIRDKEAEKVYRDKGDERTHVIVKQINLKKLLRTVCRQLVEKREYPKVHTCFSEVIKNNIKLGILHDFTGNDDLLQWAHNGAKPDAYKSFTEFYEKTTVTLFVKKVV